MDEFIVMKMEVHGKGATFTSPTGQYAPSYRTVADANFAADALAKKWPRLKFAVFRIESEVGCKTEIERINLNAGQ